MGLAYAFCQSDRELAVYYTNLDSHHESEVKGNFLCPTIGIDAYGNAMSQYDGKATSNINLWYERTDALFSQKFYSGNGLDLRAVVGLEYANLRNDQKIHYNPASLQNTIYSSKVKAGIGIVGDWT